MSFTALELAGGALLQSNFGSMREFVGLRSSVVARHRQLSSKR